MINHMRASDRAYQFVRDREGFRDKAYLCTAGKMTIGYGATYYADGHPIKPGDTITREAAEVLLFEHMKDAEAIVNRAVIVPLTQNQFDALISFVFNFGAVKFERSTLLSMLNRKDYLGAANQFKLWVNVWDPKEQKYKKDKGLKNRRKLEEDLFNEP